ncbi:hypothetical protein Sru01_39170 [Sphaerisporangium rufum]|uniref:Bacterial bifunctional deaminase-reductase C-terminal domain-containing protein n=1 Tax=Sphaerisporangium rufum TaxID=1381558 RepID=A0A919R7Y1_9ACTN|nr:hypothetical protein Sru01_39170 [Sphaerisporangium rufum]
MRKLIFAMNVSLDGYISAPGDDINWSGDVPRRRPDDPVGDEALSTARPPTPGGRAVTASRAGPATVCRWRRIR